MLNTYDWESEKSSEFVPNFIRVRGLKYSCGFGFYDLHGNLRLAIALLDNLHKNFYYQNYSSNAVKQVNQERHLTARESQIAELLCQSESPAQISKILHITQSTTYKHIANIYEKLNVSSQRELLARLLNQDK